MKTRLLLGLLLPVSLMATTSFADDKATCLDAATKGQRFKDTHKLVEARDQLRVCAAAGCPAVVQTDCANWLAEVEKALPTVVVTAKSSAGADLVDVKVTVDGQPLVSKLDGQALPMNAGPHTFHFEGVDGTLDQQVVVTEGERNQKVAIVLGAPPPAQDTGGLSTWKTVGWVLGGVGVAGLGVGTVAGIIAMSDKKNAGCNSSNVCNQGTTGAIKSTALVSDIGWIAGGVLLASGAALVLFAPGGSHDTTTGVRVMPMVTASGGGLVAGASW